MGRSGAGSAISPIPCILLLRSMPWWKVGTRMRAPGRPRCDVRLGVLWVNSTLSHGRVAKAVPKPRALISVILSLGIICRWSFLALTLTTIEGNVFHVSLRKLFSGSIGIVEDGVKGDKRTVSSESPTSSLVSSPGRGGSLLADGFI